MSTQPPAIPPRPSRSPQQQQQQQQGSPPTSIPEAPKIPPRPNRRVERSQSPLRHSYAPSPLNEKPNSRGMSRTTSNDQPQRPPSVTIPSLGEEGIEYEDLNVGNVPESHSQSPAETRNVGSDLKLHAPRPSLPTSSANAKVAAVTRTDSHQAAAVGLGAVGSPAFDEAPERPSRSLHSKTSDSRPDSSIASSDRHQSLHLDEEHGIPEIGQRVPMYPNAGDVQAPSASPSEHGPQRPGRNHHRTRSSRETSLPPGSYGLHGHGVQPNDKFEKAWYEKHPDEYAKEEQGQYGPGVGAPRPDSTLSSNDLNKIVRDSAVTGSGMGTSPAVTGTPEEEVGYIAADEYTHRIASPAPDRGAQPAVESPLRRMSHPPAEIDSKKETTTEDPGVIHVDDPYHSVQHPDGFAQTPAPEEQTHGRGESEGDEDEPILAADEVRPESAFQHPAVSPTFDRNDSFEHESKSRTPSTSHSRSNSRPTLARYTSRGEEREDTHTPLEDVAEYEPLFPEDETKEKEPISAAERFKQRSDNLKHRFPSEDMWEDSPDSLQLHATVSTPDEPKNETSETPEQESFRKSQETSVNPHEVVSHIHESEDHQEKETKRPSLSQQRFPSKDVWEDAPDSQKLVTTIEAPEETLESPEVPSKPSIPARPQRRPQQSPPVDTSTKPAISPIEKRQPPSIPSRPKPQVPSRPAKRSPEDPAKEAEPTKEAPAKPKPPVPARPGGSKIAALKAGFLTDLNSRLQVGPQGPKPQEKKEEEPPAEKKPLQDARKGRARGPARRKPAPAPAPAPASVATSTTESADAKLPTTPEVNITETWNVWQVDEGGRLVVGDKETSTEKPTPSQPDISPMAPELSKNTAGESTDPQPQASPVTEKVPKVEPSQPEPPTEPSPIEPSQPEVSQPEVSQPEVSQPDSEPSRPEPESSHRESSQPEPSQLESSHEPATEPAAKPDETTASPTGPASETPVDAKPIPVTLDLGLEEASEHMAAFADGKKESDGDIHRDQ